MLAGRRQWLRVRQDTLAFLVVVVAGYIVTLFTQPAAFLSPSGLLLVGAGLVYAVLGLAGLERWQHFSPRWLPVLYFAVQLTLGGLIAWLVLLPLVSYAQVLLRRWGAVLVSGLVLAVGLLVVWHLGSSWSGLVSTGVNLLAGIVFVAVFTQLALREQRARTEVERLAAELETSNQQLRQYAARVEQLATTQERNRVAREIHDSLGHSLTVINVQLAAARAIFDTIDEFRK